MGLLFATLIVAGGLVALANAPSEAAPSIESPAPEPTSSTTTATGQTDVLNAPTEPAVPAPAPVRPDDPMLRSQWAVGSMSLRAAWDATTPTGAGSVVVAVLDTGLDASHEDAPRTVPGYDLIDDDATPEDLCGHGTHVAGIVAAATDNGVGVAGVSDATIMPVRVLGDPADGCRGTLEGVAEGIRFAADNGADIVVLSLGCHQPCFDQRVKDALVHAHDRGVLVIAAAGNNTGGPVNFPADQPEVMAVGAVDSAGTWAPYSAAGPEIEILAPGTSILSTYPGNRYEWMTGTSMAAPHVAGAAALVWAANPDLTPDEVRLTLTATATDLGLEPEYQGAGALDAGAAVAAATQ